MSEHLLFPEKRANETIVHVVRRHGIVMLKSFVIFFIQCTVPVIVVAIFSGVFEIDFQNPGLAQVIAVLGLSIAYLWIWMFFFHSWLDYYLDVWIVTDQRVVNIEQTGLFSRVVSEVNMENIQDVTSEVHGKLKTFLDYGEVYIQSAGERPRFIFEEVAHPRQIAQEILELHNQLRAKQKNA